VTQKHELTGRKMPTTPYFYVPLALFLFAMAYAIWAIRKEDLSYQENAKSISLGKLALLVPSWWTILEENETSVSFYRSDTHYDWKSTFTVTPSSGDETTIEEKMVARVTERKILFDESEAIIGPGSELQKNPLISSERLSATHIEGMATEDGIKRVYYDAYLFIDSETKEEYFFESHSSILNGSVEGPFFEKVVEGLALN
jgi:hypothetical protein